MAESLSCNFYTYTGDPRVANKSMGTAIHTCSTIEPLEALSDLDIKLVINYPYHVAGYTNTSSGASVYPSEGSQVPAVMSANYVAIDNKYYQITNKERLTGNALAIYATLDGLMSYWSEVSNCDAIIDRAGDQSNSYISDPYYATYPNSFVSVIASGESFSPDYDIIVSYVK